MEEKIKARKKILNNVKFIYYILKDWFYFLL